MHCASNIFQNTITSLYDSSAVMASGEGAIQFQLLTEPYIEDTLLLLRHGCFSTLTATLQRITWPRKAALVIGCLLSARLVTGSFDLACHVTLLILVLAYGLAWAAALFYNYGPVLADLRNARDIYMTPSDANMWLAVSNGRVVACVALVPKPKAFSGAQYCRAAWLRRMVVHEEFRGRGIAKSLLMRALHFARARGYEAVELITSDLHVAARSLYQRCGFQLHARRFYWYGPVCVRTFEFVYVFSQREARYSDVD